MDAISHVAGCLLILSILLIAVWRLKMSFDMIGYRYLKLDEEIFSTDECWLGKRWVSVPSMLVGFKITSESNDVYRRKI